MARGRKAGSKQLKKLTSIEDNVELLVNKNKVVFTLAEKKKLESLVNSANRKRRRMLKEEGDFERVLAGVGTGQTIGESTAQMGKESDFVLAKKTKSLNRFRTKEDYNRYIVNLQRVVKRDYVEGRIKTYKENWMKSIKDVYGDQAKDILKRVDAMTIKEYAEAVQSDETLEIGFRYLPSEEDKKFQRITKAVEGVKVAAIEKEEKAIKKPCPKCGSKLKLGKGTWSHIVICTNKKCNYRRKIR